MIKNCVHCELDFDVFSKRKNAVGGKINECPDCVEELGTETGATLIGLTSGDGKQSMVTVMRFDNDQQGAAYLRAWRASTGYWKGKNCQMRGTNMLGMDRSGGIKVGEHGGNPNHKGHKA